jgi:hypothetical protein
MLARRRAFLRVRTHVPSALIFTPIVFHRRIWPSRKRSAHEFGGPCLRGSWVEKDGQTMSVKAWLLGFKSRQRSVHGCGRFHRSAAGRSCPGFCLFQDSSGARAQAVDRSAASSIDGSSPSRALSVHGFDPSCVPRRASNAAHGPCWLDLPSTYQTIDASPLPDSGGGPMGFPVASAQVRRRRLPV